MTALAYAKCSLETLTDEEIIKIVQTTANKEVKKALIEHIIIRYKGLAIYLSRKYYSRFADKDDFEQMALIGLYEAIESFNYKLKSDTQTNYNFKQFAILCMKKELTTFLKHSNRLKHKFLNDAYGISDEYEECKENKSLIHISVLKDEKSSPEKIYLKKEEAMDRLGEFSVAISDLTDLERQVLMCRIHGYSYQETAETLDVQVKAVDNAVQRVKRKLKDKLMLNQTV